MTPARLSGSVRCHIPVASRHSISASLATSTLAKKLRPAAEPTRWKLPPPAGSLDQIELCRTDRPVWRDSLHGPRLYRVKSENGRRPDFIVNMASPLIVPLEPGI